MPVEKSVTIQAKSIDDALQRAALLLHADPVDLAYEVLQQGLVDQKGVVRIPYKLRVLPIVAPPAASDNFEWPEEKHELPFSRRQLSEWSNDEFIQALQNAIAIQPESSSDLGQKHKDTTTTPFEVNGGLSAMYGSICHDGDVIIHGNVAKGVSIKAAGSIVVSGDVDVSHLEAEDDIEIAGGLLGLAKSTFGSVKCLFAQGAYIECKKKITVIESSFHSNLISGSIIDVGQTLMGGSSTAPLAICAKVVGSETGVVTKLFAGSNNVVRDEAESVRRQAARLVVKLSEVSKSIKLLEPLNTLSTKALVADRLKLWEAMSEKAKLNDRLVILSRRKNALLASIDRDRAARIKVIDLVHPQTQIEIDDVGMTVKKLIQFVTFSKDYEASALRVTSYQ